VSAYTKLKLSNVTKPLYRHCFVLRKKVMLLMPNLFQLLKASFNWFSTQTNKTAFQHLISNLCQKSVQFFTNSISSNSRLWDTSQFFCVRVTCAFAEVQDDVPKCRPDARTTRSSRSRRRWWSVHGHGLANRQNIQVTISSTFYVHLFCAKALLHCFSLIKVWLCDFLTKEYLCKSSL